MKLLTNLEAMAHQNQTPNHTMGKTVSVLGAVPTHPLKAYFPVAQPREGFGSRRIQKVEEPNS